jgi:hypothetical protein
MNPALGCGWIGMTFTNIGQGSAGFIKGCPVFSIFDNFCPEDFAKKRG